MLRLSVLSRRAKENGHQICAIGVESEARHTFNEIAMQARTPESKRLTKSIRSSHGP